MSDFIQEALEVSKTVAPYVGGGLVASKGLSKLADFAKDAVGEWWKPKAARRASESKADDIVRVAAAEGQAALIKADYDEQLLERTRQRFVHQEVQRQKNVEAIIDNAEDFISDSASDIPVDEDWRTRFFVMAQDITNEEIQKIWGKILADEINEPGTVSVRTLDVLRNLSKKEAEIFTNACRVCSLSGNILKMNDVSLPEYGLEYGNLLILRDAGLLHDSDTMNVTLNKVKGIMAYPDNTGFLRYAHDRIISVIPIGEDRPIILEQLKLTPAGVELLKVFNNEVNDEYLNSILAFINNKGYKVEKFSLTI